MIGSNPGELVVHSLLKQFASICQSMVENALDEKANNDLLKCLRLSEDTAFQQLLTALYSCAEHALPCLLQTITKWYDTQHSSGSHYPFRRTSSKAGVRSQTLSVATGQAVSNPASGGRELLIRSMLVESSTTTTGVTQGVTIPSQEINNAAPSSANTGQDPPNTAISSLAQENMAERRDLSIDILYCQALTTVLKQLSYHPGHDDIINKILDQAFRHFEYKENLQSKLNAENINTVADAYAKVVGELSQTRFNLVRQHFSTRLEHLRSKESSPHTMHSIISLLMGMKFFRVKMHPIEEFVSYFTFLHELGQYFLEVKEKEIRHAMTCLFVEILLPVAAVVRHEVNIPALKNFVDLLYPPAFELANKKKHVLALFPMVTCLLCVGTKTFFLSNWPPFMQLCLSQLKSRDFGQVSVESLFRLLWVYVVRIKCEKHADTLNKLLSIVNGLFPKGSKSVLPKNVSSTVHVKIIHFIAQEKLDFAMTEIIFDLLGVNRLQKLVFNPERMNIGLRAFLLIAHGLQQKDGEPPMPQNQSLGVCGVYPTVHLQRGSLPAGSTGGVRRSFHGTTLDDALCERLGIRPYLVPVRKAFEAILRLLEPQIIRLMMPPKQGAVIKDGDDFAPGDRKPKIDLLKTCVNCIPRLLPYEMSRTELIELLARVSLNVDEEIRMMAQQTMVNLIIESPAYRQRTIQAFIQFIQKYVPDTFPYQLDSCLKTLHTLLVNWKIALQRDAAVTTSLSEKSALVEAEGFALVMLCQCRPLTRRLAVHILRESRAVLRLIDQAAIQHHHGVGKGPSHDESPQNMATSVSAAASVSNVAVIDILDGLAPAILERVLPLLPQNERHDLSNLQTVDFKSLAERSNPVWLCGLRQPSTWNHKPLLGSNNLNTPVAVSTADQSAGNKVASTNMKRGSVDATSPSRTTRKSTPQVSTLRPSTFSQCLLTPYLLQPQLERTQLTDVWATAISVALSTSSALSLHPALLYAWNIVFHRMSQVFTLIDPNAQAAENRASSLLRSTSKKAPPTERDVLVPLWHNYVTLACCIAPSSTGVCIVDRKRPTYDAEAGASVIRRRNLLRHFSNPSTGSADIILPSHERAPNSVPTQGEPETTTQVQSPRQHQHLINSKLFISAKEKARDLVKLIIPLLRCCDHPELRDSVICGLSRIQPAAFRDVLEDLHPILRESIDLKQKNVQRRRRKDTLRSSLIRLLALMAQNAVFQHDEAGITSTQGTLLPTLIDFIEGTRVYFESLNEPSAMIVTMFGSSAGVGSITTVNHSSSSANDLTGGTTINSPTAGQTMNSPAGPSQSAVGTVNSVAVSGAGVAGSGVVSSTSGAQNSTANSVSGTTSATAATSTAPAHAPSGVDPVLLTEMRLYFCVFVRDLIRHLPRERRQKLLPPPIRRNLVLLISRWSGFYEHIFNARNVKWAQPTWIDHSSSSLVQNAKQPSLIGSASVGATVGNLPPPMGMDQVISGDLVLSISGVHLESTPQDPFISASFLDTSIWLELLWYANQSIAALVCCGGIYEHMAIFSNPRIAETIELAANTAASSSHQLSGSSVNLGGSQVPSNLSPNLPNPTTQPNGLSATLPSNEDDVVTAPTTSQAPNTVPLVTTNPAAVRAARGHPIPGYIFHWLKGLLLCRDAKLSISPWLWGLPVVNFGVCSTALKGPHGKTGVRNIRLEDSLRSIVIAAAAGRRLDSLFRQLGEETFYILLDMNPDLPGLLELLIDECYSGSLNVIQAFFVIIAQRFIKNPRMHCDRFTMLTLAMVFCEHSVPVIREHATFLLQTLYYRFFLLPSRELHQRMHPDCQQTVESINEEPRDSSDQTEFCLSALADELLWREIGHWKPSDVLRQFCAQHPSCTLPMISEICRRLATASKEVRCRLITLLHYWTINIELVDLFSRNYKNEGFMDYFNEDGNNLELTNTSISTKMELSNAVTTINPESESELEIDDRMEPTQNGEGDNGGEVIKGPSRSSESGSSSIGSSSSPASLSKSSESSHTSSISSDIDSSDCDGPLITTNMVTSASAPKKPLRASRYQNQDNRRRHLQQRLTSEQFFKPDQDGEKQKEAANELWSSVPLTLRRSGWGCLKATEMVLNNFFYLTIRFANEPNESVVLGDLWVLMIRYRPSNLRYILRYLIVAASLAPATLFSHVNRVVSYLSTEDPSGVVEILMTELQTIDGAGLVIEPSPLPPFFHITLLSETNLTEPNGDQIGDVDGNTSRRMPEKGGNLGRQAGRSTNRPLSTTTATGDDPPVMPTSNAKSDVDTSPTQPTITIANTSAISRLTNRFTSSASAMGRRALRTALHPASGGGRQTKNSVNLDQEQLPDLDIDSLDGEGEEESGSLRQAADTMPTPQNYATPSTDALIAARSQTLPYTAASRERYGKQTVVGLDNSAALSNRPSRFRKILSRRRTGGGGRRNPFKSIFGGGGGGGSGSIVGGVTNGGIKASSELEQNVSEETKLYTTSLPPNLAALQPLPLPLHSHSISHLNDYRKKRGGRRRQSSSVSGRSHRHGSRRHHRRRRRRNNTNGGGIMESVVSQQVKVAFYETSLMLQQPLPMPKDGSVYYAPMRDWFTEPFVTNGSLVYSGMWSPTGARSPLVLLLVGEVLKSHNKNRVAWRKHMPLLLLCVFLGLDHCRPLVQEESKQLLVNMLRVICPRIDLLQILSLQLEIDSQWIARAVAGFSTHVPQLFLTLDDGPSVPKFYLPVPTDTALSEVSSCPTWAAASYSASPNNAQSLLSSTGLLNLVPTSTGGGTGSGFSPMTDGPSSLVVPHPLRPSLQQPIPARPNYIFGSTYSLMSTATLIPSAAISSGEAEPTNRRSIITSDSISPSQIPPLPPSTALHPISQVQASKTPKDDCESRHLHAAAELINQMLVEVNDRSIWTWEDITSSRFQQATLLTLRSRKTSILLLRSTRFLDKFVKCVAGVFAEAEVGGKCTEAIECLQCHHGPPHHHCELESEENCQQQAACTVTRFAQAAFNMGITCPNRHYASRSLQIYRALGAQVDEKALSEVLVRLMESVSDTNDEVQGYMVELLLTLEAAVEHIQLRGTILSGGGNRSCTLTRSSALESPIVISKPPQTPPVHERRHSRRGSSSSLSSLLILPNGGGGTVIGNVGVCGVGPQASLPPIKRPLMPPHAEAVSEENEASASTAAVSTVIGPMKTTASKDTMPPLPPNVINKPSKLTSLTSLPAETPPEIKPISTNGCEIKSDSNNTVEDTSMIGTCRLTAEEQADLVSGIFWIGVCLLDSDYEYEYLAGIRILSRLLPCVCSPPQPSIPKGLPDLHEHIMKLHHRLKWTTGSSEESDFPGLLGLLLKGCFSSTLIDASCRLLVSLIPFMKSPVVDPFAEARQNRRGPGISGTVARSFGTSASSGSNYPGPLPSLIIALLPLLLAAWDEDPESTLSSTTPEITDACEMCAEGTPGIPPPTPALSLNSPPPPLGSWVHRSIVQSESSVPSPSSGYLSLVTLTIVSGAAAKKSPQVKPCNPLCIQAAENLAELAVQCDAYRFNNLAVVLRLYASGGFSKDVNQWAKCVTRYLMDGCANLGPKLLSYLTAFLTLGPPCAQLPLLHFAYWFFQVVELNQSDMNTRIRSFITSTSERFVNTPLWPEVTLLYQVIVARSATLTAAPSNPAGAFSLPGLDPSGSGRVLDSLAAAAAAAVPLPEAEPQRIALAGRVLDFDTSILASTPLIAGGKGQASPNLSSNNPAAAGSGAGVGGCQYRSPTRMAHLVEGCNVPGGGFAYVPFFFRLGAWKTPWNRQSRLRSLFTNLLNCYGSHLEHITAPRSPSNSSRQKVIFSQSTETLDRQLSMHSSSETTSINDASNPDDGNFDDTSSAERAAVFHDLDTYLDAQLMNINFLDLPDQNWENQSRCPRWGVRGHSITSHTEFHEEVDDTNQQPQQQQTKHFQNPADDIAAATTSGDVLATIPFQHGEDDDLMADEDLVVNNFDEDGLDPTATTNGADFLSYSEPRHIPLRRQSQLSIQLSTASSVNSASFAAPPPPQSRSWRSRDDSSLKWLPDNTTIIPPIESSRYSRKRTLSMQPPIVCSRRRRQDLAALGGSLDSLPSQHQPSTFRGNISGPQQQQPLVRGSTQKVTIQRSSSTVSSVSSASFKSKEMPHQQQQQPPAKPPRRKHRPSRQSLELTTLGEPPAVPLRFSSSSNAILKTLEASKFPFNDSPLTPTPAETAWIACQCQLKMLQQTSSSSVGVSRDEMTSGQRDRLRLLLTSLRSVFAGMLRRTTEGAVEMANSAFSRCPPSSDLDPEIRISHLVKIAEIIHDFLPSLFFDLHPNSVRVGFICCLDDQTMNQCLQLGSMYEEWDESIRRLSVTCAPVDAPDWKQHERICRDLQTVLQRLVNFFSWSADILYKINNSLLLKGITDFSHNLIEPLFNQMRPYLLSAPPKSHSEVLSGIDSWKVHCGRLLISKTPNDSDVRTALAIYSEAMKSSAPISMDDIMAILEACCDQLWLERKSESGFALLLARGRVPGVKVFELLASNQSTSSFVFPTDNLLELNSQDVLPPSELTYKLQKLLEC